MDIGFDILIPSESKIKSVRFEQPVFNWQGKKNPQGPKEAWFNYLRLIKSNIPEHISLFLPDSLQNKKWQCFSIVDGIDDLIIDLSENKNIEQENCVLFNLLKSIIGFEKKWVIVFEPDYDCINEAMEANIQIAFQKIINSLTVKRNGFILWFEES